MSYRRAGRAVEIRQGSQMAQVHRGRGDHRVGGGRLRWCYRERLTLAVADTQSDRNCIGIGAAGGVRIGHGHPHTDGQAHDCRHAYGQANRHGRRHIHRVTDGPTHTHPADLTLRCDRHICGGIQLVCSAL